MRAVACFVSTGLLFLSSASAAVVQFDGPWWFRTDPENRGQELGWAVAQRDAQDWQPASIGRAWEEDCCPGYDGYAWYRCDLTVPADIRGDDVFALVAGVDDAYELYVNGELAGGRGDMMSDSETMNRIPSYVRVGRYLRSGELNKFAFRIHDFGGDGGIIPGDVRLTDDVRVLPEADRYRLAAESAPDGYYPRWIEGKQVYWTITGVEDAQYESALGEEGTFEIRSKSFSVSPFLYVDGKLITSADVSLKQSLDEGYLPIPTVTWTYKPLRLTVRAFTWGKGDRADSYVTYTVENTSDGRVSGKLYLAIRPFQLVPPTMYGGMADVSDVAVENEGRTIVVNTVQPLQLLRRPHAFGAQSFAEADDIVQSLAKGVLPGSHAVSDSTGRASAAAEYVFDLPPKSSQQYAVVIPLDGARDAVVGFDEQDVAQAYEATRLHWKSRLNKVRFDIPDRKLLNTFRSNLAYALITRDGNVLQPGCRNYEKGWIRDGAEIVAAMLRLGCYREARGFIEWFAKQQLPSGEMPCIVHANGERPGFCLDWPEYDGQGAFVFACAEYVRFTGDRDFAKAQYAAVVKALKFLEKLRNEELSAADPAFRGILPKSVSHEGYIPPMHSYWDDFWALKGWKDGQMLAEIAGTAEQTKWMSEQEALLRRGTLDSIALVRKRANAEFIPGCAEKCDFDATSTAISVWPNDEYRSLPADAFAATFDKYFRGTLLPRISDFSKGGFTPYEIRTALASLIVGQVDRAWVLIDHLMSMRRPAAWNHWAEVVTSQPTVPHYLGDMPHMWIGAEFIVTFRSLFVYEHDGSLILGKGIHKEWLREGMVVEVVDAPTYFGTISYRISCSEGKLVFKGGR